MKIGKFPILNSGSVRLSSSYFTNTMYKSDICLFLFPSQNNLESLRSLQTQREGQAKLCFVVYIKDNHTLLLKSYLYSTYLLFPNGESWFKLSLLNIAVDSIGFVNNEKSISGYARCDPSGVARHSAWSKAEEDSLNIMSCVMIMSPAKHRILLYLYKIDFPFYVNDFYCQDIPVSSSD